MAAAAAVLCSSYLDSGRCAAAIGAAQTTCSSSGKLFYQASTLPSLSVHLSSVFGWHYDCKIRNKPRSVISAAKASVERQQQGRKKPVESAEEVVVHPPAAVDIKELAGDLATCLDRDGTLEAVKLLNSTAAALSPSLVGAVLKRARRSETALEFFRWAQEQDGYKHNVYSYNCMLASLMVDKSSCMEQLFSLMLDHGLVPDRDSYNLLVKGLSKTGELEQARNMLKEMIAKGHSPDMVTCGTLIEKYCGTKRISEACELFQELENAGVGIGMLAYNSILKGLMNAGDFEGGFKFSDGVVEDGSLPAVLAYRTMLDCLIKTGRTRKASEVVGEMIKRSIPDVMTYSSLINVLCKHNRTDDAMKVFDIMLEMNILPNVEVYTSLLAAHCRTRKLDGAYRLFVEMIRSGYGLNASTYGLLLRCLCNGGKFPLAYDIHTSMRSQGHLPDENTYAALIQGSCMNGKIEQARELFKEMLESEAAIPDAGMYNVIIEGLCQASKVEQALELTANMVDQGCIPNLLTYNALLMGFFKANEHAKALELFQAMEGKGFSPNTMVYSTLIAGLCKVGRIDEAHHFFQESVQRGCEPDNVTYNALIRGLFGANKLEDAERLYKEMGDRGYIADKSIRNLAAATLYNRL